MFGYRPALRIELAILAQWRVREHAKMQVTPFRFSESKN